MWPSSHIPFGTKAETLERLKPLLQRSEVLELLYFPCRDWDDHPASTLEHIQRRFPDQALVVRSSARNEDQAQSANAGRHSSILNVPSASPRALTEAIACVRASYGGDPRDQLLIQPMLRGVVLSGVLMTYELSTGAPYYVVNYDDESGRTDVITGGIGVNKTVILHRRHALEQIESPRIRELIAMAQELEALCGSGTPLDIEFARTGDALYLLQVRRVAVTRNWNRQVKARVFEGVERVSRWLEQHARREPGIFGASTILGQMPDWNPAEILGTSPRPLAVSLYRHLITDDIWAEARGRMGYRRLRATPLMVVLAERPYIDVRRSFNSFLPSGIPAKSGEALVNAWLERLRTHPELHDKVEFQVAETVFDFDFDAQHAQRYAEVLAPLALQDYRERLKHLTRNNLRLGGSLAWALERVQRLMRAQQRAKLRTSGRSYAPQQHLLRARAHLETCKRFGTLPFAMLARHAFIAETLLRSAVARGALELERIEALKRAMGTVTGRLTRDFIGVGRGLLTQETFHERYGHLRPGTYDLLSVRYDQRPDLFDALRLEPLQEHPPFQPTQQELRGLELLLKEAGLEHLSPAGLLIYARTAIVHREESKFVFTRHLSQVLELIAQWGEAMGLTRDDLSWLHLHELLDQALMPAMEDVEAHFKRLADDRERTGHLSRTVRMGYLLRDTRDLYVIPLHRSSPNFVSRKRLEADVIFLDNRMSTAGDLYQKLVCIENADPGFDWIFTRGIAGLITRFGGANSHMTIRCAELDLPAAIGVGEQSFDRLVQAGRVELSCADRIVRPAYG